MRTAINKTKFFLCAAAAVAAFSSCNKEFEDIGVDVNPSFTNTGSTLNDIINSDTTYSYFKALITKAGAAAPTASLSNPALRFTAFIPNNAAFRASGIPTAAYITANIPAAQAAAITNYVITPQILRYDSIPTTFPNLMAPTLLNPTAGTSGFNPLVSLSIFPSKRATYSYVNNIPLTGTVVSAANGIILNPAALVTPPSTTLWSRISTDTSMTYFKAAIQRGDSGAVGTARFDSLLNLPVGPSFTVFVPTNLAFQTIITAQITQALVAQGVPLATAQAQATALASSPTVFSNPLLYSVLTAQVVKGLVVYHILGVEAFTVNFPSTPTFVPTLLNTVVPTHPGVKLGATFTGPVVSAATVQGLVNPTPSNILINPTPNPGGSSDQFFTNGVLHKIDQVLRPQ